MNKLFISFLMILPFSGSSIKWAENKFENAAAIIEKDTRTISEVDLEEDAMFNIIQNKDELFLTLKEFINFDYSIDEIHNEVDNNIGYEYDKNDMNEYNVNFTDLISLNETSTYWFPIWRLSNLQYNLAEIIFWIYYFVDKYSIIKALVTAIVGTYHYNVSKLANIGRAASSFLKSSKSFIASKITFLIKIVGSFSTFLLATLAAGVFALGFFKIKRAPRP